MKTLIGLLHRDRVRGPETCSPSGFTVVELMMGLAASLVVLMTLAVLLIGGTRSWQRVYASAFGGVKQQARDAITTFGSIGRQSNRADYTIYQANGSTFTPALPQPGAEESIVSGQAVEFRYWDVPLDTSDSHDLIDVTKTATAYALFYIDGASLKVDFGSIPPGGIPEGGGSRNTPERTVTLAENIIPDPNAGLFSHTCIGQKGQGSVRMSFTIQDPNTDETATVKTATLARNRWPM
jgi:hypothetical protein